MDRADRAKKWNDKRSIAYAAQLVAEHLNGDDLFITFGYLPGHGPHDREWSRYHLKSEVIDPLRRLRKAQGVPCVYAYSTRWESTEAPAEHRLLINRGTESAELLASIWNHGPVVCRPLREMEPVPDLVRRLYTDALQGAPRYYKPITHSQTLR